MTTPSTLDLHASDALARSSSHAAEPSAEQADVSSAASRQRRGRKLIAAGFVVSVAGVVLYCLACFAGGIDAELGDMLLSNHVPFARATLIVLGLGTLMWLIGSLQYLKGAMDAEDSGSNEGVVPPGD